MLRLSACSAVLDRCPSELSDCEGVREVAPAQAQQTRSPAAIYAIQAVEDLGLPDLDPALYCICGPVGSSVHLLEKARDPETGVLVGAGFAKRSRRIHPFTILLSLQNQVAATLSLQFGWRRACMNCMDEPTSFVDLIPSMEMRQPEGAVLLLLTSAAGRLDDRNWHRYRDPGRPVMEGAIALLFEAEGELAEIRSVAQSPGSKSAGPELFGESCVAPGLEAGLACLSSLSRRASRDLYELRGSGGHSAFFEWRAP